MTIEKALEVLTDFVQADESKLTVELDMAAAMAQKAFRKQMPKKPDTVLNNKNVRACPNCHRGTYNPNWITKTKIYKSYCIFCGQALDWSDENE